MIETEANRLPIRPSQVLTESRNLVSAGVPCSVFRRGIDLFARDPGQSEVVAHFQAVPGRIAP